MVEGVEASSHISCRKNQERIFAAHGRRSCPAQVVSAWIGNSIPVAIKHYLQVTDDHFDRAAGTGTTPL
jgi:hypothetical protein